MLPISSEYAVSLIDAFIVHNVIGLALEAEEIAAAEYPNVAFGGTRSRQTRPAILTTFGLRNLVSGRYALRLFRS